MFFFLSQLTGDGPSRLVSLLPLRKFACEVRQVMHSYPSGLCFSNFAPAFRSCLGYECIVGHYGNFSKLSQLFEGIPDTAKVCVCVYLCVHMLFDVYFVCVCTQVFIKYSILQIIGEGMAKKVYLIHSKITSNGENEKFVHFIVSLFCIDQPIQDDTVDDTVTMPTDLGKVAWNILRLLVASKDHMIALPELAGLYNNAFSHQIKLSDYGYNSIKALLSSLPSIVVSYCYVVYSIACLNYHTLQNFDGKN